MKRMETMLLRPSHPERWRCPECGSHDVGQRPLDTPTVFVCARCGCRKSFEAFAFIATEGPQDG